MALGGKWSKLTEFLRYCDCEEMRISDQRLLEIVGSTDKKQPLNIHFSNPEYSITARAEEAGYNVRVDDNNSSVKIFTKKNKLIGQHI